MPERPSIAVYMISAMFFFALAAPPLGFVIAAPSDVPRIAFPLSWLFAPAAGAAGLLFGLVCFSYRVLTKEDHVGTALSAFLGGLSGAVAINGYALLMWGPSFYSGSSDFRTFFLCAVVGGFIAGAIYSRFSFVRPKTEA